MAKGKAHGERVRGLDFFDQCWQLQGLRVRETALGNLVPGVGGVQHALKAETHIFGVQFPAWGEIFSGVKFDPRAQFEIVHKAIRGH